MWLFWRKITKLKLDITYQHSNNNLNEITRLGEIVPFLTAEALQPRF